MPNLKEVHLGHNNISLITNDEFLQGFENVHSINIEGNKINSWDEVRKLARLPS